MGSNLSWIAAVVTTVSVATAVVAMMVLAATGEPAVAWAQVFSPVLAEAHFAVPAVAWAQLDEPVAVEDAL